MHARSLAVDAIKGLLVALMVVYHACYVAVMFGLATIELYSGFWWLFPRGIAAGFIAVMGWNLAGKRARGGKFRDAARRALKLALIAAVISGATRIALGDDFVFFGIIHLMAVASIAAWPLAGRPALAAAIGTASLLAGLALGQARFGFPWLAWLGFRPEGAYPADYLPLLPWFAYAAFGVAAFDAFAAIAARREGERSRRGQDRGPSRSAPLRSAESGASAPKSGSRGPLSALVSIAAAVGRRSLAVYLVHLPLLYAIGWLVARSR